MIKNCRFFFLLGALPGLTGCPDTPCVDVGISIPRTQEPGVILVGEEARLRIGPSLSNGCGAAAPETPSSLTVEISGPDNQPVPHQATLGKPSGASSTVTFTPDKPGRYHIFAAFDPIGGIQQFDFYAARNRSAEALVESLPQVCSSLERTKRGGWACDSDFIRDGSVVQRFNGARLAVAGDVVWAVSGSQTQRFVDTGTGLELTATLAGGSSTTEFLLPSENELLAIRTPGVDRIVFDGSPALALKGSELLPVSNGTIGSTGLKNILVRSGNQVLAVTNATPGSPGQPPSSFVSRACPYRIEPDRIVRGTEPCQTFTGDVVGYEPGGLWVATRFSFGEGIADLRWVELTGGVLAEQASLPLGSQFMRVQRLFATRNTAVPVILSPAIPLDSRTRPTVPVYAPDRRAIFLEFLDAEVLEPSASPGLLWGGRFGALTPIRIRIRPTTP